MANKVLLMGRLTRDPDVRYTPGENGTAVARYTIAVDRRFKKDGEPGADFIPCVVFGKGAEFAERYLRQGTKMFVVGRIQTGSYTNKDGVKIYTTDVVVEEQEFAESKRVSDQGQTAQASAASSTTQGSGQNDEWMNIPDGVSEQLPWD